MTSGRILVVDDEPQIRRVLRTTLSAQGYEVFDARTSLRLAAPRGRLGPDAAW